MPSPVGFCELHNSTNDLEATYHIEWLTNEDNFPSLSSVDDTTALDWQVLNREEIHCAEEESPGLISTSMQDGQNTWEYICLRQRKLYVETAAEAEDQLADVHTLHPFPCIHPYKIERQKYDDSDDLAYHLLDSEDDILDEFYTLYRHHKSHAVHSHVGSMNHFNRMKAIVALDPLSCVRLSFNLESPDAFQISQRMLHYEVNYRTHAKRYRPPGPRNANNNKMDKILKRHERLKV